MTVEAARAWTRRVREVVEFLLPSACLACQGRLPLDASRDLVCGLCLTRLTPPSFPRCERCGFPLGTGAPRGDSCLECSEWPEELTRARSAFLLRPPADALVHALKYGGWVDLAEPMGCRMARIELPPEATSRAVVVPMPTTQARRRRRGYNQAERLARIVARERGLPMIDALLRTGRSHTQVALHPTQRRANVENAFSARPDGPKDLAGMRVLLVDDVLTTGATAGAAARALHTAGARTVTLATFARALPFRTQSATDAP